MADELNAILNQGDKIQVFSGADAVDTGSFISAADNFMVWADSEGNVRVSFLGGSLNVQKV